jgi:hypothetical protein
MDSVLLGTSPAGAEAGAWLVRPQECAIIDDTTLQELCGTLGCAHDYGCMRPSIAAHSRAWFRRRPWCKAAHRWRYP